MRRVRTQAALAVLAMVAALGACSSSPDDTSETGGSGQQGSVDTMTSAQNADAKTPAPKVPDAREGGTLTVLSSSVPHTFDPTRAYYLDVMSILKLVTRGLTQTRYVDGKPVLVPDLATDLGRPNEDFTRWEFTLRDGLKYENGDPVTSADVAWSIKRQMAQAELPDGPTYGLDYYLAGDTYQGPWADGKEFDAVETPDDKTIVIKMRKPFPSMPYYASLPAFTPIPESADQDPQAYGNHPLATGPYKFEEYRPGELLTLVRNPHWDPATDPNRHQYADRWVFEFGLDPLKVQQRIIADEGADQYALTPDQLLAENLPAVRGDPSVEERLLTGGSPCVNYMWMDTRKINPIEVRRAVVEAWPIASQNEVNGEIPGMTWNPGTSIMPSVVPGWISYDPTGRGGKGDGDPKDARRLLKSVGQLGFELSFYYAAGDEIEERMAKVWRKALEKAGFNVKPIPAPEDQMRTLSRDPNAPINLRLSSWCADWANADSVLPAILDGRKADAPGAPNASFLNVEEINEEMDRILALPAQEALAEWGKLDKLIMEKYLPMVPLGEGGTTLLRGSKVGNMKVDAILSSPDFTQMYAKE